MWKLDGKAGGEGSKAAAAVRVDPTANVRSVQRSRRRGAAAIRIDVAALLEAAAIWIDVAAGFDAPAVRIDPAALFDAESIGIDVAASFYPDACK
jgi:hypothetical protein